MGQWSNQLSHFGQVLEKVFEEAYLSEFISLQKLVKVSLVLGFQRKAPYIGACLEGDYCDLRSRLSRVSYSLVQIQYLNILCSAPSFKKFQVRQQRRQNILIDQTLRLLLQKQNWQTHVLNDTYFTLREIYYLRVRLKSTVITVLVVVFYLALPL